MSVVGIHTYAQGLRVCKNYFIPKGAKLGAVFIDNGGKPFILKTKNNNMWYHLFLSIAILLYLSGIEITISPFSISFNTPLNGIGSLLLYIGIYCILYEIKKKSYYAGQYDATEVLIKANVITSDDIEKMNDYVRGNNEK